MSALHDIRTRVFRISQQEMAQIAGVHQSTVSRWERGVDAPGLPEMSRIRDEAVRRRLEWDDGLFFNPRRQDGGSAPPDEGGATARRAS